MCFIFDKIYEETPPLKVAKTNLLAWKRLDIPVVGGKPYSPSMDHPYDWGVAETSIIRHSFHTLGKNSIENGLHSYSTKSIADSHWFDSVTFPVIIPKGAQYAYNQKGEVVSTSLIVFKDMKSLRKRYKNYKGIRRHNVFYV